MELSKYFNLPDSMAVEDLADLFEELIDSSQNRASFSPIDTAEALEQLADRQWHTYSIIDEKIKIKIEKWIQLNWGKDSLEFTELVTSIVGKLGLTECIPILKAALKEELSIEVKDEIEEALNEYGKDVAEPYSGLH